MDRFEAMTGGITGPGKRHYAITPANTDLAFRPRAIFVIADGALVMRDELGADVTYTVAAGMILPFRPVQVRTGTTATVVGWD